MLRRTVICMALMAVLLSGGCDVESSPKDQAGGILLCSIGVIILSWPVVILLTLLGRRLNLVRNRVVLQQYGAYLLIQVVISLNLLHLSGDLTGNIIAIVFIPLLCLPYLFLISGLLIFALPTRLLAWIPSFLLIPYYLMFTCVYLTDNNVILTPFFLTAIFTAKWYLPTLFGVLILLLIRRIIGGYNLNRPYKLPVDRSKKQ